MIHPGDAGTLPAPQRPGVQAHLCAALMSIIPTSDSIHLILDHKSQGLGQEVSKTRADFTCQVPHPINPSSTY